jgi:hypothetical protein
MTKRLNDKSGSESSRSPRHHSVGLDLELAFVVSVLDQSPISGSVRFLLPLFTGFTKGFGLRR